MWTVLTLKMRTAHAHFTPKATPGTRRREFQFDVSEDFGRLTGGRIALETPDLAPFYPMKIAAGRRPAGSTALRWFPLREFRLKTIAPCARSTTVNPGAKLRILAKAPGPEETNKKRTKITIFQRSTVNRNILQKTI